MALKLFAGTQFRKNGQKPRKLQNLRPAKFSTFKVHCPKKWNFPLRISSVNWSNPQETGDLVTFTEEVLNGKYNQIQSSLNEILHCDWFQLCHMKCLYWKMSVLSMISFGMKFYSWKDNKDLSFSSYYCICLLKKILRKMEILVCCYWSRGVEQYNSNRYIHLAICSYLHSRKIVSKKRKVRNTETVSRKYSANMCS